ncbi:hypothetical protein Q8G28_17565 [Lysinibacillus capsici]|uniref:hypothetical protein n=1 Tax=Lysinibacillus capsici TaxID=2115968 RepID=UPI002732135C|nr:hypothetical protein [Lysinibacillus capsici]MDP1395303.1 hypothetical protein [Lysinibacillus capsici]MDP1415768.1 hypothetical protein [Lysinibacillus capsici]MDP1431552.1 hypothetical protein [Lysinibacillus capsici]
MPKHFEDFGKTYTPKIKVPPALNAMNDIKNITKKHNEDLDNQSIWYYLIKNYDKDIANIPVVQSEDNNDIAAGLYTEENNEIPNFTPKELMQEIDLLKKSSNCDSITEYKQKISNGEIINFSHAQIELWEMLEGKLQELEDEEY